MRLDLEPVAAAPAGLVTTVDVLGHDPFESLPARLGEQCPSLPQDGLGENQVRISFLLEKILQALPPLPPRQIQQGHQVLIEQIEGDVSSGLRSAECANLERRARLVAALNQGEIGS